LVRLARARTAEPRSSSVAGLVGALGSGMFRRTGRMQGPQRHARAP
jgi:hypothetical protein